MRNIIALLFLLLFAFSTNAQNTSTGTGALGGNTTGTDNSAFGHYAIYVNSTGSGNSALGYNALFSNTTSGNNTAIGSRCLAGSTGASNTALGSYSGNDIQSGYNNILIGYYAGRSITSGHSNTIIGSNFGYSDFSSSLSNTIVIADGDGNQRIYVNSSGYTGLGTTSPQATLDVQGGVVRVGNVTTPSGYKLYVEDGILTEKVKVAVAGSGNWSDFVFNDDYPLWPLSEVEKYIKANKHLPGIPSASEVEKEGIDLAAMDAKLLEKIEELTLHLINQQKEIENLKKMVQELSAKK